MKQFFYAALFLALMLGMSATAYAQTGGPSAGGPPAGGGTTTATPTAAGSVRPGCSHEFMDIQKNRADAMRTRDKAWEAELVYPNDTTLGTTCFDQAMGVTGRLGSIFSDTFPGSVPAANTVVFTPPLAYPNWGADDFLIKQLEVVILPPLQYHLANFSGTLTQALGTTQLNLTFMNFLGSLTAPISGITSAINGFTGQINSILSAINLIQSIAASLSLPLPSPVIIGIVAALRAAQSVAQSLMNALQSAMNAAIMPMINGIMGQVMGSATNMQCDVLADLWDDGNTSGGAESVQGHGIDVDVPYGDYANFLTANLGGGAKYTAELGNNRSILDKALDDLAGPLLAPGTLSTWKTVPMLAPNAPVSAIIGAM